MATFHWMVVCEPPVAADLFHRRVVLVDDEPGALEVWALLLTDAGVRVEVAPGGDACLRLLDEHPVDLIVIDFRLEGETGLDVMRRVRARGHQTPFLLVSGHASIAVTVEAMRMGARTVLEKPLIGDDFLAPVLRELRAIEAQTFASFAVGQSSAQRWAQYVLRGTEAAEDPRTLADWARAAGVSRSALIEVCSFLEITPKQARDFMRVLRIVRRDADPWEPEASLNVADRRTLRKLLARAGLSDTPRGVRPALTEFLQSQRFVSHANAGFAALVAQLR